MADQTAVAQTAPTDLPDNDDPDRSGPALMTSEDADVVQAVRSAYPYWQTESPTVAQVRTIAGGGQSRAIRLRTLVQTADFDGEQTAVTVRPEPRPAAVRRPSPTRAAPVPAELPDSSHDLPEVGASQTEVVDEPLVAPLDLVLPAGPEVAQTGSSASEVAPSKPARSWPVLFLLAPAFVAIWSGWVGVGGLTGFGVVHPLPGIWDAFSLNTAITLPVGMEVYAAYGLSVWLGGRGPVRARRFAKWSAIGALALGAFGQVAYHLMVAAHITSAPWPITTAVACLPVAVLGMGAALAHLNRSEQEN